MNRQERRKQLAALTKARHAAAQATRAAELHPDDHELLTKAFALAATVKLLEGLVGQDELPAVGAVLDQVRTDTIAKLAAPDE